VITALFSLLLSISVAAPSKVEGVVISVADGDTLTVLTESKTQSKIRLASIDAPERAQPFGNKAKQALSSMAYKSHVMVKVTDTDRYGRYVGEVFVDGRSVNAALVQSGMAWVYRKYSNDSALLALEAEARAKKVGLWSDGEPIEPWLWRKGKRDQSSLQSSGVVGNKRSNVYHLPECPSYSMVSERNRQPFRTESDAIVAGYVKAGNCP
jgi:micrococcal nuclease